MYGGLQVGATILSTPTITTLVSATAINLHTVIPIPTGASILHLEIAGIGIYITDGDLLSTTDTIIDITGTMLTIPITIETIAIEEIPIMATEDLTLTRLERM